MGFTIPSAYPTPIANTGAPDVIRALTVDTILQRDRFIFAYKRRMLAALSPFFTSNTTTVDLAATLWVHNSQITFNRVVVVCYGLNADVTVYVNAVSTSQTLGAAPAYFAVTLSPGWTNDTWVEIKVEVQANAANGGYYGLYIYEDHLQEADLP
jgi:hypothetical protein